MKILLLLLMMTPTVGFGSQGDCEQVRAKVDELTGQIQVLHNIIRLKDNQLAAWKQELDRLKVPEQPSKKAETIEPKTLKSIVEDLINWMKRKTQ